MGHTAKMQQAFSSPGRAPVQQHGRCAVSTHATPSANHQDHAHVRSRAAVQRVSGQLFAASVAAAVLLQSPPAPAVLNSPNARIARTPEAALRRATPAFNADVKMVQSKMEDIQTLMRIPQRKPWGGMAKDVQAAQGIAQYRSKMMAQVPDDVTQDAEKLVDTLVEQLEKVQFGIDRKDPDRTSVAASKALTTVSRLEVLQAPALTFQVPAAYRGKPILTGRATAELVVEKADQDAVFVDNEEGGTLKQGVVRITLDGYSAPVSAGQFAKLVRDGKYDGMKWGAGFASVTAGRGAEPGAQLPLEILPIGQFEPVYRLPLDTRGGELPALPLSIRGSVAMGRLDDVDGFVSGEEFFIFKFTSDQAGLAGLAFEEGEFGVFGYVTDGMEDVIAKLGSGDKIVSAKLTSGAERLVNA